MALVRPVCTLSRQAECLPPVDAPINLGWGSKQTQFHGSLGKAAAQAPSQTLAESIAGSPDDDGLPRIAWRADGAFFAVSAPMPRSQKGNEAMISRRVIRVFDRAGALQSTCEPIAGLEHALAWRPPPGGSGGAAQMLASTQRFGFPGGGAGRAGRHDVVFFERNGLRHGEFGLRMQRSTQEEHATKHKWGYRVRDLAWNADATVLAVWMEAEESDCGMIQEITSISRI